MNWSNAEIDVTAGPTSVAGRLGSPHRGRPPRRLERKWSLDGGLQEAGTRRAGARRPYRQLHRPRGHGKPTVCPPNPATKGCTKPYHDVTDIDGGGPHNERNAIADVNGEKMNGFIIPRTSSSRITCSNR
jgi:hypothetical protein